MSAFLNILKAPGEEGAGAEWFAGIAEELLNETVFMVGGRPHRFLEVEFYFHGGDHQDPFAHCDPLQKTCMRWYFHRDKGSYRGGSFKGLDISFGPEGLFGGVLIRTIADEDGQVINGCSLCVDHMLKVTGHARIADLDAEINDRAVDDAESPLHLRAVSPEERESREVIATARVGLTLKRMYKNREMPRYIMRPYRFITAPKIKKGKLHTVIALHKAGLDPQQIRAATGSPAKSIANYIAAFDEGAQREDFNAYRGKSLKTADLCQLHGTWSRAFER